MVLEGLAIVEEVGRVNTARAECWNVEILDLVTDHHVEQSVWYLQKRRIDYAVTFRRRVVVVERAHVRQRPAHGRVRPEQATPARGHW